MYGTTNTITLDDGTTVEGFKFSLPYPNKTAVVRLPTDTEIVAFYDDGLTNAKNKDEENMQPYVDMFAKIRLDKGEDFDEYETSYVINNLLRADAKECKKEGPTYRVALATAFGDVVNILRLPSLKELNQFHSALAARDLKGIRKARLSLFDKLASGHEGYACPDVPIHHKIPSIDQIYIAHAAFDPLKDSKNV